MRNLAELILEAANRRPRGRFGTDNELIALAEAVTLARRATGSLQRIGLRPGGRAAVIGETSTSYLLLWMSLQLAGVEAALVNPALPEELLAEMLADLTPDAVIWAGGPGGRRIERIAPEASEYFRPRLPPDSLAHLIRYCFGFCTDRAKTQNN